MFGRLMLAIRQGVEACTVAVLNSVGQGPRRNPQTDADGIANIPDRDRSWLHWMTYRPRTNIQTFWAWFSYRPRANIRNYRRRLRTTRWRNGRMWWEWIMYRPRANTRNYRRRLRNSRRAWWQYITRRPRFDLQALETPQIEHTLFSRGSRPVIQDQIPGQWPLTPPSSSNVHSDLQIELLDPSSLPLLSADASPTATTQISDSPAADRADSESATTPEHENVWFPVSIRNPGAKTLRLRRQATADFIATQRVPMIPNSSSWPSWYNLQQKRIATGIDFPCNDEAEEDDSIVDGPSFFTLGLSQRGEFHLQDRLEDALSQVHILTEKLKDQEKECSSNETEQSQMKGNDEKWQKAIQEQAEKQAKIHSQVIEDMQKKMRAAEQQHQRDLKNAQDKLTAAEQQHQTTVKGLEQRLMSLQQATKVEIEKLKSDSHTQLKNIQISHKSQLNQLVEENLKLSQEQEVEHGREILRLQGQVSDLEGQLSSITSKAVEAAASAEDDDPSAQLAVQLLGALETIQAQNASIKQLTDDVQQAKQELEQNTTNADEAAQNIEVQLSGLQNQLHTYQCSLEDASRALVTAEQDSRTKDEQLQQLQTTVNNLQAVITEQATATSTIQPHNADPNTHIGAAEVAQLQGALQLTQQQCEQQLSYNQIITVQAQNIEREKITLQHRNDELSKEIHALKEQLLQLLTKPPQPPQLEQGDGAAAEHRAAFEELTRKHKELQAKWEEARKDLDLAESESETYRSALQRAEEYDSSTMKRHKAQVAELDATIKTLRAEAVAERRKEEDGMMEERLRTHDEITKHVKEIQKLKAQQKDTYDKMIDHHCKEIAARDHSKSWQKQSKRLEQGLQAKEREITELQGQIEDFEAEKRGMAEKQGQLNYLDEVQIENKKLREDTKHWKSKYHNDMKDYQKLQKENALLQCQQMSKVPTANPSSSHSDEATTKRLENMFKTEQIERAKAEEKAVRFWKMTIEKDKQIAKLERLESTERAIRNAERKAQNAKSRADKAEAESEKNRLVAEEERQLLELAETKVRNAEVEMKAMSENMAMTENLLAAEQRYGDTLAAQLGAMSIENKAFQEATKGNEMDINVDNGVELNKAKKRSVEDAEEVAIDEKRENKRMKATEPEET